MLPSGVAKRNFGRKTRRPKPPHPPSDADESSRRNNRYDRPLRQSARSWGGSVLRGFRDHIQIWDPRHLNSYPLGCPKPFSAYDRHAAHAYEERQALVNRIFCARRR